MKYQLDSEKLKHRALVASSCQLTFVPFRVVPNVPTHLHIVPRATSRENRKPRNLFFPTQTPARGCPFESRYYLQFGTSSRASLCTQTKRFIPFPRVIFPGYYTRGKTSSEHYGAHAFIFPGLSQKFRVTNLLKMQEIPGFIARSKAQMYFPRCFGKCNYFPLKNASLRDFAHLKNDARRELFTRQVKPAHYDHSYSWKVYTRIGKVGTRVDDTGDFYDGKMRRGKVIFSPFLIIHAHIFSG